jgi:AhpD family alkylhydroperoxidase
MTGRISIHDHEPDAYKGMYVLDEFLGSCGLDAGLMELIKIRASQINGCAYCIQLHTEQARKLGDTEQRLYALSAWKESPLFTELERSVLALTDEVTHIANGGVSQAVYETALAQLGEKQLAQCIMQISTMNAWNRIAIATELQHES